MYFLWLKSVLLKNVDSSKNEEWLVLSSKNEEWLILNEFTLVLIGVGNTNSALNRNIISLICDWFTHVKLNH